jgi:peptidoglycan/xylan/chitin deacetylase (PgdA/CDA1 family)
MRYPDRFSFPDGIKAALSMTFDDSRRSQLDVGLEILARHGVAATFYVEPKTVRPDVERWRHVAASGHEIANHTMSHICSGNFNWGEPTLEEKDLAWIEGDILAAQEYIETELGVSPISFAYPCGQPFVGRGEDLRSYVPIVAKHFLTGRGFFNEPVNDPSFCDLANLNGTEGDGITEAGFEAIIDQIVDQRGWAILAAHEVGYGQQGITPEMLDHICAYCTDEANGIWLGTVGEIATYIHEHRKGFDG